MSFLESAPQITSLSTKSMHERGGVLQLDKYPMLEQEFMLEQGGILWLDICPS